MAYSVNEKLSVINQLDQGVSVPQVIKDTGISRSTLYRWKKQHESEKKTAQRLSPKEITALLRRVEKLEKITAILQKVNCTIHDPLQKN